MAATCLHCDKKIGLFKKPIDGLYCTYECRTAAREQQAVAERRSEFERTQERAVLERAAQERLHSEVVAKAIRHTQSVCPKCAAPWRHEQGGGSLGLDHGSCGACGFATDFLAIERCPHCRCESWVIVAADEARCPRCKTRSRRIA